MNKHGLAISVLENKADYYRRIANDGEYRYGDPKDEIDTWRSMAVKCDEAAEALKALS